MTEHRVFPVVIGAAAATARAAADSFVSVAPDGLTRALDFTAGSDRVLLGLDDLIDGDGQLRTVGAQRDPAVHERRRRCDGRRRRTDDGRGLVSRDVLGAADIDYTTSHLFA